MTAAGLNSHHSACLGNTKDWIWWKTQVAVLKEKQKFWKENNSFGSLPGIFACPVQSIRNTKAKCMQVTFNLYKH